MSVRTYNLNQAAMFVALGAKLVRIDEEGSQWQFILQTSRLQRWYEKYVGYVPYRKFCAVRVGLKKKKYKQDGRDYGFRGEKEGFVFEDVVRVIPFTEKEREHLKL